MKKEVHKHHRHQVQNPLNQKNQLHQVVVVRMTVAHRQNQVMDNNLKVWDNFLGF